MSKLKVISSLALAVSLCTTGLVHAERLKYGDYTPQGANEYAKSAEWMGNEIAKRSGNKHTMMMLWVAQLLKSVKFQLLLKIK